MATTSNSRGRDPRIFVFDGGLEDDWAGRSRSAAVDAVNRDLASVMGLLASDDDVVIAERPHDATLARWQARGLSVPQFVSALDPERWPGRGVAEPWGWSASLRTAMAGAGLSVPDLAGWTPLHDKTWAVEQLQAFAEAHPGAVAPDDPGRVAHDRRELAEARSEMGHHEHWIKAGRSAAGRHRV
ncbi:MAG: hypothetical protein AAF602_28225, partial [Myxococcota bacterium]